MRGKLILLSRVIFLIQVVCCCPENCRCSSSSRSVDCSQQGLVGVPSNLPPQTLMLYLQDNQIHQLPAFAFRSVPQLIALNLGNNSLSFLASAAFHGLWYLQVLNLTQNSLHSLESELFHSLPQLRELDLSSNNLSHLPPSLGKPWENLTTFAVQKNHLQQLDRVLLESMATVRFLFLKDNLWKCNCHLLGLKLWLENFIYKGGVIDGVICVSPDPWKGQELLRIPHELYHPCPFPSSDLDSLRVSAVLRSPESRSECELKPKPRLTNLRHAVATVVITGILCGIVCLMILAATIYGCTYAVLTAQNQGGLLAQIHELSRTEGKEPLDSSPA